MTQYINGSYLSNEDLDRMNQFLARNDQDFEFRLFDAGKNKLSKDAVAIVLARSGKIGDFDNLKTNDVLQLEKGEVQLEGDAVVLSIQGNNLFASGGAIYQRDFPIQPSTLGGTRKLLKDGDGKFNIDAHLIWVDKNNVKIPHYHKKLFELYLTEQGRGEILLKKLGQDKVESPALTPSGFVLVPPNTVHKAQGEDLLIMVVGIPAFYHDDSFVKEV